MVTVLFLLSASSSALIPDADQATWARALALRLPCTTLVSRSWLAVSEKAHGLPSPLHMVVSEVCRVPFSGVLISGVLVTRGARYSCLSVDARDLLLGDLHGGKMLI